MTDPASAEPLLLRVGGLTRADLEGALADAGVGLNASAETLLADAIFDHQEPATFQVIECTVEELQLTESATLPHIFAGARAQGLLLCPPYTGPYLRLAVSDQTTASDSVLSNGHAPTGSVTVASEPLRSDAGYPKGFYLRVVDGRPWLRGYRCSTEYLWSREDMFAFRV